jgi:protein-S-isoprenylcysteine O-methyltransferase Ste14
LAAQHSISLPEFYKSFKSLQGVLAGAFCFGPPISNYFLPGLVFPPLGGQTILAQFFAVLFGVGVTFLCFLMKDSPKNKITRTIKMLFVVAILLFVGFFGLHFRFVRTVTIPSAGTEAIVSVGYQRTEFANLTFPGATDLEMLRSRGFDEDEITHLWTRNSVYAARIALFLAFLGAVLSLVGMASLGVLLRVRGE